MSNLLWGIEGLKNAINTARLSSNQCQFIMDILKGDPLKGCKPLDEVALQPVESEIQNIIDAIKHEIRQTPWISFWPFQTNFFYINTLKTFVNLMNVILEKKAFRENLYHTRPSFKIDRIYQDTLSLFQGTVHLPVIQSLDDRMGESKGECLGYVAEWSRCLLSGENPFGISPDSNLPTIAPIRFDSPAGRKYPELNHLAHLNLKISQLQKSQSISLLSRKMSHFTPGKNFSFLRNRTKFYGQVDEIANELIELSAKNSSTVYHLGLKGFRKAHATGFCLNNQKYHFFDSNAGWFIFSHSKDFKRWLPYYFTTIGYNRLFGEYSIIHCNLSATMKSNIKSQDESHFFWYKPLVFTIALAWHFVGRGFIYIIRNMKFMLHRTPEIESDAAQNSMELPYRTTTIPRSSAWLDLEENKIRVKKRANYTNIAGLLDIPVQCFETMEMKETPGKISMACNELSLFEAAPSSAESCHPRKRCVPSP